MSLLYSYESTIVIIGLGNFGKSYLLHRHNIGYLAIDVLLTFYNFIFLKSINNTSVYLGVIGNKQVILIKPKCFINESGKYVSSLLKLYKVSLDNIFIIYDDLDISFSKLRIKKTGDFSSHKGINNIDHYLGKNYWRIRVGIGHPGNKKLVSKYVLSPFSRSEKNVIDKLLYIFSDQLKLLIYKKINFFISRINQSNKF